MKLVVCDDDPTLRGVISRIATSAGLTVLAETDTATGAIDLVDRFGAEVLVLDISLPWGSGLEVIRELNRRGSPCRIVVFTSYASDDPAVRDAAVHAVIEKPDFELLETTLGNIVAGVVADIPTGIERRRPARERRVMPAPAEVSPSGLESPAVLADLLECVQPGDGVLVVHVAERDIPVDFHDRLVENDRFLLVARSLRACLRPQDRMFTGDPAEIDALLLDAGKNGVASAWNRLISVVPPSNGAFVVSAGWAVREDTEPPATTLGRARAAARQSIGRPEDERLWSG